MSDPAKRGSGEEPKPEKAGNEEYVALGIGCLVALIFLASAFYYGMMRQ